MLSVNLELPISAPAYGPKARSDRHDQQSDEFSALVDNKATVSESDQKQAPASDVSSKSASTVPSKVTQDDRRTETASVISTAQASATDVAATDAAPLAQVVLKTDGDESKKKPDTVKILPDEKKADSDGSGEQANAAIVAQPAPALAPDALAIVTVIASAPESAATPVTPRAETPPAPAAIAAAAAVTVAAAVAATTPQVPVKSAKAADTTMTTASASDAALPADPEIPADVVAVLSPDTAAAPASIKTEAPVKFESTVSVTDRKQAIDGPLETITPDRAEKPDVNMAPDTDAKPAQHKAAAAESTIDSNPATPTDKAAPQLERSAQSVAPLPQRAVQPDQILQPPSALPQPPVQHHLANLTAIPVSAAPAALTANTPVPVSGLAVDIALRAAGGSSRFEIRLDPAELGRIDVRLDVDKHGNVTSHLTVERPATLEMLRQDAPRLQQALEDAGLKTGNSGLQFSLRDQSSSGRDNDNGASRNSQRLVITDEDAIPAQIAGRTYGRSLASSGGIDIRI